MTGLPFQSRSSSTRFRVVAFGPQSPLHCPLAGARTVPAQWPRFPDMPGNQSDQRTFACGVFSSSLSKADLSGRTALYLQARVAANKPPLDPIEARSYTGDCKAQGSRFKAHDSHEKTATWNERPDGVGDRPRLYGHVAELRRARRSRIDTDHPSGARSGRHVPRHGGCLRQGRERDAGGPGHSRAPARGGAGDEVRADSRPERPGDRRRRPSRARQDLLRREPRRASASTSSISTTLTASTRRCRSRTRSAPWPNWSAKARCASSVCRKPGPRRCGARAASIRSPRCRANIRCGRAFPSAPCFPPAASSASGSSRSARSAAAF